MFEIFTYFSKICQTPQKSQTNTTNQTLTVEMSSTGTYDFKVAALTATNTEGNKWSDPIENVVVT